MLYATAQAVRIIKSDLPNTMRSTCFHNARIALCTLFPCVENSKRCREVDLLMMKRVQKSLFNSVCPLVFFLSSLVCHAVEKETAGPSIKAAFASPANGNWQVHDNMPNQWPELVKRLLLTSGPAAFVGSQPNKWFIHHEEGPREDVEATYVWLRHLENGYTIRKNGPARSPEE